MRAEVFEGDCRRVLDLLPADTFDSGITDPPYHLQSLHKRFAAKGCDEKSERYAVGAYGRHAKGFMGKQWDGGDIAFRPETWVAVYRVLKPGAHLLAFGGTRGYHRMFCAIEDAGFEIRDSVSWLYGSGFPKSHNQKEEWEGWGTALKPAWEPICVARKPLTGTVAANLQEWGTGALNIDGCRVASTGGFGRWPANVAHDGSEEVLSTFPEAPGQQGRAKQDDSAKTNTIYGVFSRNETRRPEPRNDAGSAARFFYCAKASRADRNEGCFAFTNKPLNWSSGDTNPGAFQSAGTAKAAKNNHPTVKPNALMRWLCRLVTPPGGSILDPFAGSGSTGKAAVAEGFRFTGIESESEYVKIAKARIAAAQPSIDGVFG